MCIAIIGSRTLSIPDLGIYLPKDTTEIISGGAKGVDTSAREYALAAPSALDRTAARLQALSQGSATETDDRNH